MDGPRGHYATGNKSDRERQILYDFTYMWNLKKKKRTNIIKQKQSHRCLRYRENKCGCQRGGGEERKR